MAAGGLNLGLTKHGPSETREAVRGLFNNEIRDHLASHFGAPDWAFAELVGHVVHIDLLFYKPTPGYPAYRVVTCGMSELALPTSDDPSAAPRAELTLGLPTAWGDAFVAGERSDKIWQPMRVLKSLSRHPHLTGQPVGDGTVLPFPDPETKMVGHGPYTGALIAEPVGWPAGSDSFTLPTGEALAFYAVYPLYEGEFQIGQRQGAGTLAERLASVGISEIYTPMRADASRLDAEPRG